MKRLDLLAASALALLFAAPAVAQDATTTGTATDAAGAVDEASDDIIVTATKREQTLQDVPISVSVTSDETIERAQIRDLIDLASVVPSLKVTQFESAAQTNFTIRGFGNGNGNDGLETSVGVFIDGVYRSRSASALDDLPEIERIEVLRGPQSTLFGKNVSAGAISIVTKKPQFEWGGKAEVSLANYGQINPGATISGPLGETVAVRLSGSVNQRDGYFQNVVTRRDVNDRDRWSVRGDVLWEPSADLSLRVIGDYNVIDEVCCGAVTVFNGPATLAIGALGFRINDTSRTFDRNLVFNTDPSNRLVGKGLSGQIDWSVGFAKLTSITAYRQQTNRTNQDVDFTAADIANRATANKIKTFTQELRLASDNDGPFSWLIGGFYQDERLDTGRDIRFGNNTRAFIDAITVSRNAQGIPTGPAPLGVLETLLSVQTPLNPTPSIGPGAFFRSGQGISDFYATKQRSYSLFGQADFEVTERLTLTGGVAYLNDRKTAVSNVVLQDPFSSLNLRNLTALQAFPLFLIACPNAQPCPASVPGAAIINASQIPANAFAALEVAQFFYAGTPNHAPVNFPNANESGILKGDKITYAARAAYDFDIVNVYVSYSTGWKAGAFNLSSDSRPQMRPASVAPPIRSR